jgi:hypothetical protein
MLVLRKSQQGYPESNLIFLQVPTDSSCKSSYGCINYSHMKLVVLTLVHIKIIAFRHVTQCSLVDR